jgi:tetratricopeptide (TPR) repeat protein
MATTVEAVTDDELAAAATTVANLRALVDREPHEYQPQLAQALLDLSDTLAEAGRVEEAITAADEAVDRYEELAERFSSVYLDHFGWATFTLGQRLCDVGRTDDGHALLREGLELRRRAHRHNPYDRARYVGLTLTNYSVQLFTDRRFEQAAAAAADAVGLYRAAREEDPDAFAWLLGTALTCQAVAEAQLGRFVEALDLSRRSVNLGRRAAPDDPSGRAGLAQALRGMAIVLGRTDPAAAIRAAAEAVELGREIAGDEAAADRLVLAWGLLRHGATLVAFGQSEQALPVADEAAAVCRPIAAVTAAFRYQLALSMAVAARAQWGRGSGDRGRACAAEALDLARAYLADEPSPGDAPVTIALLLGSVLAPEVAVDVLREAMELHGSPTECVPRLRALDLRRQLATALDECGRADEAQSLRAEAALAATELPEPHPLVDTAALIEDFSTNP